MLRQPGVYSWPRPVRAGTELRLAELIGSLSSATDLGLARVAPGLYGGMMGAMTRHLQGDRGRLLREMTRELNGRDQEALAQPEVAASFTDAMFEAVRPGFRGVALDVALINRRWRLRLQDVPMRVRLWHGEDDHWVPVSMGRYVAAALGRCDATFVPGEGHISLLVDHADEILKELSAA